MNALFLINETIKEFGGISMKILNQVDALKRLGFNVMLSELKPGNKGGFSGRYIGKNKIDQYSKINLISKIQSTTRYKNLYRYIIANEIKMVYVRYVHFANPFFISFLRKLKKNDVKVLLEIPTYPYDQEYTNLKITNKILHGIEKRSRKKFNNLVSHIITFTPESNIFGVPAIEISNGIEVDSINTVKNRKPDSDIHLIGVASIAYWHGYDRVIEGIYKYYDQHPNARKVFFHIIGDSLDSESMRYKKLAEQYDLRSYIKFHGKKFHKDLDDLFNEADIAVGCLGCHRKGMSYSKSLKNREYAARGLPFFYSDIDSAFEGQDFILKVPPNDTPVNINDVISFLDRKDMDPMTIRNYARENLSWDKQFEKIVRIVFPDFE